MKSELLIRIFVSMLLVLQTGLAFTQDSGKAKTHVVFVCEHGGARSTIASVYFNKMVKEKNLPYESIFRAITPDSSLSENTSKGLTADGFNTTQLAPVVLVPGDITANSILISIDCDLTSLQPDQKWSGIPAISKDYIEARNEIVKRLKMLIYELQLKNK